MTPLDANREAGERVFLNRCGQPMTRFGIHTMVERQVSKTYPKSGVTFVGKKPYLKSGNPGNSIPQTMQEVV
jgi:hypothetical protein